MTRSSPLFSFPTPDSEPAPPKALLPWHPEMQPLLPFSAFLLLSSASCRLHSSHRWSCNKVRAGHAVDRLVESPSWELQGPHRGPPAALAALAPKPQLFVVACKTPCKGKGADLNQ